MKNVIKRGTSLLLVLAMLLSFAAVVGAEEPATPEKILTLTVENAVLHAGETKCLPVYETVKEGHSVDMVTLSAISDNKNVVVKGVYAGIPAEWTGKKWIYKEGENTVLTNPRLEGISSAAAPEDIPLLTWLGNDDSFTTSDLPLCYVQVTATADAAPGAYQINMTKDPNVQEKTLFSIVNPEGGRSITKTADDAILNPGTVIVLPDGVNLPTVILTDDTFAVPTWEEMKADKDEFALASRLKIIGGDKKLYDVDAESLVVSAAETLPDGVYLNDGKTLELATRAEANTTGISLTVKSAKAVGADISISAPATVTAKISKATPYHLYTGFGKSGGYVPAPTTTQEVTAAEYSDSKAFRPISLNAGYPAAFDQFGKEMDSPKVKLEVMLFSDEECRNPLSSTDDAYQQVTVTENQTGVQVSNQLKKDVWCMVKTYVEAESTGAKTYGEQAKVHIISQYPQAEKAVIKLTDGSGNPFSGNMEKGTFDIPGGSGRTTIKFAVDKFLDKKNNEEMKGEAVPTNYTVAATQTSPATPADDVTISIDSDGKTGTITVGSGAIKTAPVEIEIKVTLADNTELTGILKVGTEELPAKITLKKGNPFATSLASYDSNSYAKGEIRADSYEGNALPTVLPGIGGDEASVVLAPLYVLDQYDAVMQTVAAANYKLYKVDGETKTPISADYAKFENGTEDRVTLKLTNALAGEEGAKSLALTAGNYQIEATYNNKTATANFALVEGETKLSGTPIYYDVETGNEPTLYVPYTYGTLDSKKATTMEVGATITTQYGRPYGGSETPAYALNNVKLNEETIENKAITWTAEADGTGVTFTVDKSAAQLFGTSNTATLTAEMTVTVGEKSTPSIPISITLRKDASKLAHLVVTGTPNDGTAAFTKEATILDDDVTASYNLIVPNTGSRTYTIALSEVEDQYGTALTDRVSTSADVHSATYDNGILTINPQSAGGKAVLTFTESGTTTGHKVELTLNFAQMSFVNSDGADYKVGMWLNTNPKDYAGQTWAELYNQIKWGAAAYPTVHIENEDGTAGQDVTSSVKVVVKKDGAEVFDSSKTYTEQPKANAGTYTIELIYVKDEGEGKTNSYPIDSFTNFTISPKTVKITANRAITKEYDGTANLPDDAANKLELNGVVENDGVSIDTAMLEFASANAGENIAIRLKEAGTNCLKTASGEPATNYTAGPSELKGTITARQLTVTPKAKTFEYGENDKITNALTTEFDYAGKNGDLPSGLTPTITGSMKLTTTSGADVTVYNAGTYNVVLGNLSLTGTSAGNYQLELASGTHTWTISKKSVDAFNVTLEADFGVYGSELYAMLNTAKVTVDGQQVNLSTLYDVEALCIKGVDENNVPKTDALVNAGMYTVSGWDAAKKTNANYSVTSPKVTITVNPHTLTSADIQSTDNWGAKDFTGEEQTFTAFKVSFTYNERTIDLVENQDYVIVDNSNKGTHSNVTLRIKAADGSTNYTGEARAPQSWSILTFKVRTGDLEIYQTNTLTYDGTPKTPEFAVRVVSTDSKRQKVLNHFTIANNYGDMWGDTQTDAGSYTAGGSFARGFSIGDEGVNTFTWTIGKSDKTPIQNQTASTKYGQPGSKEISVSDGVKKGLDTSDLSVLVLTDTNSIIKGTPSVTFENGKIIVNWQLQGDATTIDKTATLRVTVAETDNYKQYTFDVDVTVTAKTPQTNFGFTTATDATVGYAEDTYTNPVQNAKTTPAYTSSNQNVATVASNGVVTILDVGTTTITANAPENGEYASATASYTLTVVPSTLTVTASSATMTANDSVPSFTASVTGLKRGQTTAQVFQTLTASAATDGKTAGTYAVNASATLKTDFVPRYTLRFVPGTLTVNPAQTAIDVVLPIIIGGNTCANGYANCACESFYDLDASRWYHEAIDWAYSLGLMNGTTKSTFGPNAAATRAQTWTMLARIAGQDTRRSSTWYEVGQKWAMNLGITDGTNPMGSLTREQLAAMLYRYVGSPAVNGTLTFTDSANVSTWARNAMIWAVQNGILDGVGGNRLNPKGTTTRAQAAAIFMRFSKLINK